MNRLTRKVHYWMGIAIALPLLVVVVSGILLQLKKQIAWVQPPEQSVTLPALKVTFGEMERALAADSELGFRSWDDASRIDIRPSKGMAKVILKSGIEVQIDTANGKVLQKLPRRSDLIESFHDGSFFGGNLTKLGVFLPSGIALLFLLLTGLWLWWLPIRGRRRKASKRNRASEDV